MNKKKIKLLSILLPISLVAVSIPTVISATSCSSNSSSNSTSSEPSFYLENSTASSIPNVVDGQVYDPKPNNKNTISDEEYQRLLAGVIPNPSISQGFTDKYNDLIRSWRNPDDFLVNSIETAFTHTESVPYENLEQLDALVASLDNQKLQEMLNLSFNMKSTSYYETNYYSSRNNQLFTRYLERCENEVSNVEYNKTNQTVSFDLVCSEFYSEKLPQYTTSFTYRNSIYHYRFINIKLTPTSFMFNKVLYPSLQLSALPDNSTRIKLIDYSNSSFNTLRYALLASQLSWGPMWDSLKEENVVTVDKALWRRNVIRQQVLNSVATKLTADKVPDFTDQYVTNNLMENFIDTLPNIGFDCVDNPTAEVSDDLVIFRFPLLFGSVNGKKAIFQGYSEPPVNPKGK